MSKPREKELDQALETELRCNPVFAAWFLGHTKFGSLGAKHMWSRADHPWGKVLLSVETEQTSQPSPSQPSWREGETDVLAVFETEDGRRVALHIENKLGTGRFTHLQPETYAARAEAWKENPKYGSYMDWETVLVAPRSFRENTNQAQRNLACASRMRKSPRTFRPLQNRNSRR